MKRIIPYIIGLAALTSACGDGSYSVQQHDITEGPLTPYHMLVEQQKIDGKMHRTVLFRPDSTDEADYLKLTDAGADHTYETISKSPDFPVEAIGHAASNLDEYVEEALKN